MDLIGSDIIESQLIRRPAEMRAEVLDGVEVHLLGRGRHVAQAHVVEHALAAAKSVRSWENSCRWTARTRNPDSPVGGSYLFPASQVAKVILCDVGKMAQQSSIFGNRHSSKYRESGLVHYLIYDICSAHNRSTLIQIAQFR